MISIGVYRDQQLAMATILKVREVYPGQSILSIGDGVGDLPYAIFCVQNNVFHTVGPRLKVQRTAGQWTLRYLKEFLKSPDELLIKIDPDTRVLAALDPIPEAEIWGRVRTTPDGIVFAHGGCVGMRRAVAQRLVDSGLLESPEWQGDRYLYMRFGAASLKPGERPEATYVTLEDLIVARCLERLGIPITDVPGMGTAFLHE